MTTDFTLAPASGGGTTGSQLPGTLPAEEEADVNTIGVGLSPGKMAMRALWRHKGFRIGGSMLLLLVILAIFGSWIRPFHPNEIDTDHIFQGPSRRNWFGTDDFGRDILSRVITGSRLAFQVAFGAVAIAMVCGTTIGLVAGYFRGKIDSVVMRIIDIFLAFPGLVFALAIAAVLGNGMDTLIIAVGVGQIPGFARIIRGATLSVVNTDFVLAAKSIGCRHFTILRRHILPNIVAPLIVIVSLDLGYAVLTASSISFLGIGVLIPTPEWGAMAAGGRPFLIKAWWIAGFPAIAISVFVLAINIIGDALRDALDARLRRD